VRYSSLSEKTPEFEFRPFEGFAETGVEEKWSVTSIRTLFVVRFYFNR